MCTMILYIFSYFIKIKYQNSTFEWGRVTKNLMVLVSWSSKESNTHWSIPKFIYVLKKKENWSHLEVVVWGRWLLKEISLKFHMEWHQIGKYMVCFYMAFPCTYCGSTTCKYHIALVMSSCLPLRAVLLLISAV